jgi:hypothetical protein
MKQLVKNEIKVINGGCTMTVSSSSNGCCGNTQYDISINGHRYHHKTKNLAKKITTWAGAGFITGCAVGLYYSDIIPDASLPLGIFGAVAGGVAAIATTSLISQLKMAVISVNEGCGGGNLCCECYN